MAQPAKVRTMEMEFSNFVSSKFDSCGSAFLQGLVNLEVFQLKAVFVVSGRDHKFHVLTFLNCDDTWIELVLFRRHLNFMRRCRILRERVGCDQYEKQCNHHSRESHIPSSQSKIQNLPHRFSAKAARDSCRGAPAGLLE